MKKKIKRTHNSKFKPVVAKMKGGSFRKFATKAEALPLYQALRNNGGKLFTGSILKKPGGYHVHKVML